MKIRNTLASMVMITVLAACSSGGGGDPQTSGDTATTGGDTSSAGGDTGGDTGNMSGQTASTGGGTGSTDGASLNGDYIVDITVLASLGSECDDSGGQLTVSNGNTITGAVSAGADGTLTVSGTIEADGSITGGFAFSGGAEYATYSGMVDGASLRGDWQDQFGCSGTWVANPV